MTLSYPETLIFYMGVFGNVSSDTLFELKCDGLQPCLFFKQMQQLSTEVRRF